MTETVVPKENRNRSVKVAASSSTEPSHLNRVLSLWDLIIIGVVIVQPIAPMGIFGIVNNEARGHVVTTILIAMVAMLFTAISYGKMARAYPSAGSAYTYVGREIHPVLGYVTGWAMLMDYILNPLVCTVICAKLTENILPGVSYGVLAFSFASAFTILTLRAVKTSARINEVMAAGMMLVVIVFFLFTLRFVWGLHQYGLPFFVRPFYNPATFNYAAIFHGTSIAVLTYIGFDAISTLSEEAKDPKRDVLRATVLVCVITGVLSALEVYAAQLVWGQRSFPRQMVESAFPLVARQAGGFFLFHLLNFTMLIANVGSGMGAQLAAARLLYGMGRSGAVPPAFFAKIDPKQLIPRNNLVLIGAIALVGAFTVSYERGVELLNFGAFIAFMCVNLAALCRYFLRSSEKNLLNLVSPALGFCICFFIWLNLGRTAKMAGAVWLLVGVIYGTMQTRGFSPELINFEVSSTDL